MTLESGADRPSDWVVAATEPRVSAEVLRAALETAGIPCHLFGETIGDMLALTAMGLGEVKLLVPADRAAEARELISQAVSVDFPESD